MSAGLRKLLVAGAALLAIAAIMTVRLNSSEISQHFYQQLQHITTAQLSAQKAELTFMHGIGLRLDDVNLKHPKYQLHARHMNISLRLLPLLLGKTEADTLDIHDAEITIQPESLAPTSDAISSLPVQRIRLLRSRIQSSDGKTMLDNLYLELRNIGLNREMSWEMKATQTKQAISGNGRLLFRAGKVIDGFGKLSMSQFQLARLQPVAPPALFHWLSSEGNLISGAVTLDIGKAPAWALFGEVELQRDGAPQANNTRNKPLTILKLRGKLSHPADGELRWRDSFIHIGKEAVITLAGVCHQHCNTTLDAKQVPLSEWSSFIPADIAFYKHMQGKTDLNASFTWDKQQWQGQVALNLSDAIFNYGNKKISLPPMQLHTSELGGENLAWHAEATITSTQAEGSILIRNARHDNGNTDLFIDSHDADSALWQPLANMMLTTIGLEPNLQASGPIDAKVELQQHKQKQTLSLDVKATPTQIAYATWVDKPEKIQARCKAKVDFSGSRITTVKIEQCSLNTSSVEQLNWSQKHHRQTLSVHQLDLKLEQFHALLPEYMEGITGTITGSGRSSWKEPSSWLCKMDGQWQWDNVGAQNWHASGAIQIQGGAFRSHQLQLDGSYGKAVLYGWFDPLKQRGDIDIISGQLDWSQAPNLSEFWQQISLKGRIYTARLKLLDNDWQQIQTHYVLTQGKLQLKALQSTLADGSFSSNQLSLQPSPDGIKIQGNIRSKGIQLRKLSRLHHWIGAAIDGKLQANIILHGRIGQQGLDSWQGSNGDILIYDGNWKHQQAISISEKIGISTPLLQSYSFSKLDFRFRIGKEQVILPHIILIHMDKTYSGSATISSQLHMTGMLRSAADKTDYALDSILPQINWDVQ